MTTTVNGALADKCDWVILGEPKGTTPILLGGLSEYSISVYYPSAGFVVDFFIIHVDLKDTVRNYVAMYDFNGTLFKVKLDCTYSQIKINEVVWGSSNITNQCQLTIRGR